MLLPSSGKRSAQCRYSSKKGSLVHENGIIPKVLGRSSKRTDNGARQPSNRVLYLRTERETRGYEIDLRDKVPIEEKDLVGGSIPLSFRGYVAQF